MIKDIKSEKTKTIQIIQNNFTYFSQKSSPSKSVSQNNTEKRRTSFKPNHIYRSRRKIDNEENKKESEANKENKNNAFSNENSNKSKNLDKNNSNNESNKNQIFMTDNNNHKLNQKKNNNDKDEDIQTLKDKINSLIEENKKLKEKIKLMN